MILSVIGYTDLYLTLWFLWLECDIMQRYETSAWVESDPHETESFQSVGETWTIGSHKKMGGAGTSFFFFFFVLRSHQLVSRWKDLKAKKVKGKMGMSVENLTHRFAK